MEGLFVAGTTASCHSAGADMDVESVHTVHPRPGPEELVRLPTPSWLCAPGQAGRRAALGPITARSSLSHGRWPTARPITVNGVRTMPPTRQAYTARAGVTITVPPLSVLTHAHEQHRSTSARARTTPAPPRARPLTGTSPVFAQALVGTSPPSTRPPTSAGAQPLPAPPAPLPSSPRRPGTLSPMPQSTTSPRAPRVSLAGSSEARPRPQQLTRAAPSDAATSSVSAAPPPAANESALEWSTRQVVAAAAEGRAAAVQIWLTSGGPADAAGRAGTTMLMAAAAHGRERIVELLINGGAAVDRRSDASGCTALMAACTGRHSGVVRQLLRAGAAWPGPPNFHGRTAVDELALASCREVLSGFEFNRALECARHIMAAVSERREAEALAELHQLVPPPRLLLTAQDAEGLEAWHRRVAEEREALGAILEESARRSTDHEAMFVAISRNISGRNVMDSVAAAAKGFHRKTSLKEKSAMKGRKMLGSLGKSNTLTSAWFDAPAPLA